MKPWAVVAALLVFCAGAPRADAQDPPPRIPRLAIDIRADVPRFPDDQKLADSRRLDVAQLPGMGVGGDAALHVYPYRWRAVTLGAGGQFTWIRARSDTSAAGLPPATTRFAAVSPQVSLNFGSGAGWSYLSGGVGLSRWSIVADGSAPVDADREWRQTINYGGGARWFAKAHLAFTFDVRFYAIRPGTPAGELPGAPRTTFAVVGAGISLK